MDSSLLEPRRDASAAQQERVEHLCVNAGMAEIAEEYVVKTDLDRRSGVARIRLRSRLTCPRRRRRTKAAWRTPTSRPRLWLTHVPMLCRARCSSEVHRSAGRRVHGA